MGILARAGEEIKDRDGKLFATVATDIHSGDVNLRANQFTFADGNTRQIGAVMDEEIFQFIRDRLAQPPIEDDEPKVKASPDGHEPIGQTKTVTGFKGFHKGRK